MNQKVNISVTQEDIDLGQCGNPRNCPVSRAFSRVLKPEYIVAVCGDHGYIRRQEDWSAFPLEVRLHLPCGEWVACFDMKREVEPFNFSVEIPVEFLA